MSDSKLQGDSAPSLSDLYLPQDTEIEELMETIENSQKFLYQMINLESWALATTMDQFSPGFWSRFLQNRRQALKEGIFHKQRQKQNREQTSQNPH